MQDRADPRPSHSQRPRPSPTSSSLSRTAPPSPSPSSASSSARASSQRATNRSRHTASQTARPSASHCGSRAARPRSAATAGLARPSGARRRRCASSATASCALRLSARGIVSQRVRPAGSPPSAFSGRAQLTSPSTPGCRPQVPEARHVPRAGIPRQQDQARGRGDSNREARSRLNPPFRSTAKIPTISLIYQPHRPSHVPDLPLNDCLPSHTPRCRVVAPSSCVSLFVSRPSLCLLRHCPDPRSFDVDYLCAAVVDSNAQIHIPKHRVLPGTRGRLSRARCSPVQASHSPASRNRFASRWSCARPQHTSTRLPAPCCTELHCPSTFLTLPGGAAPHTLSPAFSLVCDGHARLSLALFPLLARPRRPAAPAPRLCPHGRSQLVVVRRCRRCASLSSPHRSLASPLVSRTLPRLVNDSRVHGHQADSRAPDSVPLYAVRTARCHLCLDRWLPGRPVRQEGQPRRRRIPRQQRQALRPPRRAQGALAFSCPALVRWGEPARIVGWGGGRAKAVR